MTNRSMVLRLAQAMQVVALLLLGVAALVLLTFTILSALGIMPWLTFEAQFGTAIYIDAGHATQIGVTALLCLLFLFIPSQSRLLSLERSHRDYRIGMDDVAQAFHLCHTAKQQQKIQPAEAVQSPPQRPAHVVNMAKPAAE